MNRFFSIILICFLSATLFGSNGDESVKKFTNPILAGFYPDPSITKVGDDYYLVNSTFAYFPAIPVFHSKDLVNWELIGHVLDRPEQFDAEGLGLSRGLFAPAIEHHNGKFYVTCTIVDGGGNFVAVADKPEGPYSNPVWLPEVNGIDPSLFFDDENGKTYLLYNSDAPDNKPLYDGHRTIRILDFDIENLKTVGEDKILVNGGADFSKKPIWIEGPHIYKRFGYYYLSAAEGGTAEDHRQVVFRSKEIYGPYEPYKNNPILTQRHLDPKREHPVTSTGHADLVETDSGQWWAVFLGIRPYRPYEKHYYNLGRETFLAPVEWIEEDGAMWPVINPDYEEVQYYYDLPDIDAPEKEDIVPYSGNFTVKYDFDSGNLHKNFIFLRTPKEKWYEVKDGSVAIKLRPETCGGSSNPSFIAHRQQHIIGSANSSMSFQPKSENEKAGLAAFLNENHYYFICKSIDEGKPVVQLYKAVAQEGRESKMELVASETISQEESTKDIKFKIDTDSRTYSFYYAFENEKWNALKENLDGTYLRAVIPRDFIGCVIAMYATSLGETGSNSASFEYFEYSGNDEVYR